MKKYFPLILIALYLSACGSSEQKTQTNSSSNPINPLIAPTVASSPAPTNYTQSTLDIPLSLNDTYYGTKGAWSSSVNDLWGFDMINPLSQFSSITLPSQEIIVAIIDTGVDYDAPDLAGRLWLNPGEHGGGKENNGIDDDGNGYVDDFMGWNWVNNNNNPVDDMGHGSHLAGTIAAIGNNSEGVVGISPWVRIMSLKVCNYQGACNTSDVRSAIHYAYSMGAKVINLSIGMQSSEPDDSAFEQVISDATDAGTLVVVAAGNAKTDTINYTPADATNAMAVSAIANDGALCSTFSNYGFKVDVAAPGCGLSGSTETSGILSINAKKCGAAANASCCSRTPIGDRYCLMKGTSMAAPHIAGLAALAYTASPDATPYMIRQAILNKAIATDPFAPNGRNNQLGSGRGSALGIVSQATQAPGIKITYPRFMKGIIANPKFSFSIQSRANAVNYTLKYIKYSGLSNINLASGTTITSGNLAANQSQDFTQLWTPPEAATYSIILEATSNGQVYRDMIQIKTQ